LINKASLSIRYVTNNYDGRSFQLFRHSKGWFKMDDEYDQSETHQKALPPLRINREQKKRALDSSGSSRTPPTILIVDDDALILELGCEILKRQGYIVLSASLPSRALEIAQEHEGIIDLLITDIIMPEMNGNELANDFSYISPVTKILLMSGYTGDIISKQALLNSNMQFIEKPFSGKDMKEKVKEMLSKN